MAPGYLAEVYRSGRLIIDRNEDWRGAISHLNRSSDRLPVLLYAGLIETRSYAKSSDPLLRDYCTLPARGIYELDDPRPIYPLVSLSATGLPPETCRAIDASGGVWMLLRVPEANSAAAVRRIERLASSCRSRARLVESITFGGVTAARLVIE
jgi:hypothetical protein